MTTVDITGELARYMAEARDLRLAPHVAQDAKHRILDTLAAMVSGSHLQAGEMAIRFTRAQGGVAEATVLTTDIRTSAVNAALANGMFAHADETDDFESAEHRAGERKGAVPDDAGAGRRADTGGHSADQRTGRAQRSARAAAVPGGLKPPITPREREVLAWHRSARAP